MKKFRLKKGWFPTSAIKIILLFPVVTLTFLIGWLCYILGERKNDKE